MVVETMGRIRLSRQSIYRVLRTEPGHDWHLVCLQRKLHRSLRWTDRRHESRAVLGGTPKSSNVRGGDAQRRFASGVLSLEENAKLRGKWAAGKCHQPQRTRVSQPPLKASLKCGKPWNLSSWVLCRFHSQPPCCSGHRL